MNQNAIIGFAFTLLAGLLAGSFALPMKFTTGWKWQHNWGVFAIWALFIMPFTVAIFSIPDLQTVYRTADNVTLLKVFLLGLGWGIGVICFGLGLEYLGIALGLSIMLGLVISLGALFPIILFYPDELTSPKGLNIMLGSGIILVGIIICAVAGAKRDKIRQGNTSTLGSLKSSVFIKGLVVAILAGLLSTMQNIGFVAGKPIQEIAVGLGANSLNAGNAVWPVLMAGCLIANLAYCVYLIAKYKEWGLFTAAKKWYWLAIAASGIAWFLCMMFFGMGVSKLGKLGPSIGWASFQTFAIITGNAIGFIFREWQNSPTRLIVLNWLGIFLLMAGIIVLAF